MRGVFERWGGQGKEVLSLLALLASTRAPILKKKTLLQDGQPATRGFSLAVPPRLA